MPLPLRLFSQGSTIVVDDLKEKLARDPPLLRNTVRSGAPPSKVQSGMGLVLVEGESQIADILIASNVSTASPTESMTTATATATSTPKLANSSTSASTSLVVEQGYRGVVMAVAFITALAPVLAGLLPFSSHYLDRNINVDVQNIYRGLEPQKALMRFACSMSRSIDPRRPWKLTPTQSASINILPCIVKWSRITARLSGASVGSRREERYQKAQKRLTSERARQRRLLLLDIVDRYKKEQPVIDSERQLSGKVVDEDVRGALERSDHMTPEQLLLIDAVLTLPETSLERENQRRITAINAVTAYCVVEEGVTFRRSRAGRPVPPVSTVKAEKPLRSEADIMLRHAISSVTTDKRPTICFACLGNPNLTIRERVVSFSSPGCLTRHFMRKHVRRLGVNEPTECRICDVRLEHRMHFQNHAEKFHGTVSQFCN
ncbi:hypothetical protein V494_00595 [Pseudogymnoascus sp. VKM F-4513 (FW-928)]|nr:hypothetical protein V494_00595 [Pseudogymnoascus sp. VKM F-4513 (FW-928)]